MHGYEAYDLHALNHVHPGVYAAGVKARTFVLHYTSLEGSVRLALEHSFQN